MSRRKSRRVPLITAGMLLIIAASLPTVTGMLRVFGQMSDSQAPVDPGDMTGLAFHPAVMLCGAVGCLLVGAGLCRFLFTAGFRQGE